MPNRHKVLPLLLVLFSLVFAAGVLQAASVKDRMAERIPAINALKDQGLIGENNGGFLEFRTGQKPSQALIQDENNDRKSVYAAIAQKEGVSAQLVGQRRAKMLADNGKSGHWFQQADGTWYQK
jgi:uncharacterized protein YdbL (DUF1318 family)